MRRLFRLLAICLPFAAALAAPPTFWLRNNGAWEGVARVSRTSPGYSLGTIHVTTNGLARVSDTNVVETGTAEVVYESRGIRNGQAFVRTNFLAISIVLLAEYTNTIAHLEDHTLLRVTEHSQPETNITSRFVQTSLPGRLGLPQSVLVGLPYTDLLDPLPLDYPETYIHVRTGFDGYIHFRFDEADGRMTIRRLFPEKLPYERKTNIRVIDGDHAHGGV